MEGKGARFPRARVESRTVLLHSAVPQSWAGFPGTQAGSVSVHRVDWNRFLMNLRSPATTRPAVCSASGAGRAGRGPARTLGFWSRSCSLQGSGLPAESTTRFPFQTLPSALRVSPVAGDSLLGRKATRVRCRKAEKRTRGDEVKITLSVSPRGSPFRNVTGFPLSLL